MAAEVNYLEGYTDFFELFNDNDTEDEFERFEVNEVNNDNDEIVENDVEEDQEWQLGDLEHPSLPRVLYSQTSTLKLGC